MAPHVSSGKALQVLVVPTLDSMLGRCNPAVTCVAEGVRAVCAMYNSE